MGDHGLGCGALPSPRKQAAQNFGFPRSEPGLVGHGEILKGAVIVYRKCNDYLLGAGKFNSLCRVRVKREGYMALLRKIRNKGRVYGTEDGFRCLKMERGI